MSELQSATNEHPHICSTRRLPAEYRVKAAARAVQVNPTNMVRAKGLAQLKMDVSPDNISKLTTRYWQAGRVHLRVKFLDDPSVALRHKILDYMNSWGEFCDVQFVETVYDAEVRLSRYDQGEYAGCWSYVGTDILAVPQDQPTMNLHGFSDTTDDQLFSRIVKHETGHTLGFMHEHLREQIVKRIDQPKAIRYYQELCGWSKEEVEAQILTSVEDSAFYDRAQPDTNSIMCYQIPAELMLDGIPALGGEDFSQSDLETAAKLYPRKSTSGEPKNPLNTTSIVSAVEQAKFAKDLPLQIHIGSANFYF